VEARVRLASGPIVVDVDPGAGGRLAQIWMDGTPVLVGDEDVPDVMRGADGSPNAIAWGSYPMVPWAGRIRHGRFEFDGRAHTLAINDGGHAIHGVGFTSPWTVTGATPTTVQLDLVLPADDRWPFGGHVTQTVSVTDDRVALRMTVTAGEDAFPVSIGWHPWFRKPDRIDFHPVRMYRRDDEGITVGELVDVAPGPWDDCFINHLPVALTIDGVDLRLTSSCTRWVVFDELPHATCVEPQTAPPDAFTIAPEILVPGSIYDASFEIAREKREIPDSSCSGRPEEEAHAPCTTR
jgi:aldose 1-epimerase